MGKIKRDKQWKEIGKGSVCSMNASSQAEAVDDGDGVFLYLFIAEQPMNLRIYIYLGAPRAVIDQLFLHSCLFKSRTDWRKCTTASLALIHCSNSEND